MDQGQNIQQVRPQHTNKYIDSTCVSFSKICVCLHVCVWVEKDTQFCQLLVGFKYFVIQWHKLQPVLLRAPCSTHTAKQPSRTFPAKHVGFPRKNSTSQNNSQPIAPMDLCNHPKQKCQCSRPFYYCTIFQKIKCKVFRMMYPSRRSFQYHVFLTSFLHRH